jgi:hypothetical protein
MLNHLALSLECSVCISDNVLLHVKTIKNVFFFFVLLFWLLAAASSICSHLGTLGEAKHRNTIILQEALEF